MARAGRRFEPVKGYLWLHVESHIVIYRETEMIWVVRILHKAMDASSPLKP
jgi:plasmid stabilization system protein ParE